MTDEAMSRFAPAHDQRHDDPQVSAEDPARLYPHRRRHRHVPRPIARAASTRPRCPFGLSNEPAPLPNNRW
jgi:hypothetical protein